MFSNRLKWFYPQSQGSQCSCDIATLQIIYVSGVGLCPSSNPLQMIANSRHTPRICWWKEAGKTKSSREHKQSVFCSQKNMFYYRYISTSDDLIQSPSLYWVGMMMLMYRLRDLKQIMSSSFHGPTVYGPTVYGLTEK